ncbi:MAG: tetraacyldisaccharide 4'-kinase [Stellaceae bacterium]
MSPPDFWSRPGLVPSLLQPAAELFAAMGAARRAMIVPWQAPVPVICVGNLVLGGAGKTPVVASLARLLRASRRNPHILSRGYGGSAAGPLRVDPACQDAAEVGDEPVLLAREAPVWVARDRAAGARAAVEAGADCLLLDDGFQNPSLIKNFSLLVIDGAYGLGNGRVVPAGPLREPAASGLGRADAIVVMGEDRANIAPRLTPPVFEARLAPVNGADFAGREVIAFAGIGRPEKFFATLADAGAKIVGRHAFSDHHRYRDAELHRLRDAAAAQGAVLVTTEKDRVRLPPAWQAAIASLEVRVAWHDEAMLMQHLERVFDHG